MKNSLVAWLVLGACTCTPTACADEYDRYTNAALAKAADAPGVLAVDKLTPALVAEHGGKVVSGTGGVLLVVRTNGGHNAKLVAQLAQQRTAAGGTLPVGLLERFVTYKPGQERAVLASGPLVQLFDGFLFDLDL